MTNAIINSRDDCLPPTPFFVQMPEGITAGEIELISLFVMLHTLFYRVVLDACKKIMQCNTLMALCLMH
ncbi:MAG: hypothetical protein PSN37_02595 [Alphaproteobacteria bacterium]|nr:hypothetical protein [Alphaproteobacteria bacterium]